MTKLVQFWNNWIEVMIKKSNDWKEDIWLNNNEIALLFEKDSSNIAKHIKKIYNDWELDKNQTSAIFAKVQNEWWKQVKRSKEIYNLDIILSVWYKVNWKKWWEFRKWANQVLWQYLKKWYVVNEKVMLSKWVDEIVWLLDNAQLILKRGQSWRTDEFEEILGVIKDYSYSFKTLQDYDEDKLSLEWKETGELKYRLEYESALKYIAELKKVLMKKWEATELFGQEKTHQSLWWIIWNIFNCFSWGEPYPSLEEKASHLLYFIIKNHPFNDWNKRIWSFLFQSFIKLNKFDRKENWEKKINDTTLVAIALMIAESDPKQKDTMTKLVVNLLRKR